jgi:hypothetical protein
MKGPAILGIIPAPQGLRAVYAFVDGESVETKVLLVVSMARVGLPDQIAVSGMTLDPRNPTGFVLCQANEAFVFYLNPGESMDDLDSRVSDFVEAERKGNCGHCGEKHPRKKRKR